MFVEPYLLEKVSQRGSLKNTQLRSFSPEFSIRKGDMVTAPRLWEIPDRIFIHCLLSHSQSFVEAERSRPQVGGGSGSASRRRSPKAVDNSRKTVDKPP